jgi:arabinofuranosyltransferase
MLSKRHFFGLCLGAAVVVATYYGWKLFFFTTDDAYIAFRYASNSLAGLGLTWNPPPFRPVEGYTSFLWVSLLREVWRLFGVEPPVAANYLSLLFGYATLYLGYRFIARMNLPAPLASARWAFLVLVMVGTLTNRTFLTWLSSGLETSLFNFLFTWWVYEGTASTERRAGLWAVRLSLGATLTALARPDGMLLVLGTPLILCAAAASQISSTAGVGARLRQLLPGSRGAWPLLGIPLHFVWRRVTYGDWLPNTYYAKRVAPWPESGARYLASFIFEYGIVIWMVLALSVLIVASAPWWKNIKEWTKEPAEKKREAVMLLIERSPPLIAVAVLIAHFGYYTFDIGGDHFEYRVYSHLVLLIFVSAVWLLGRLATHLPETRRLRPWMAFGILLVFVVCAQPIPWTHWAKTHDLETRRETYRLIQPVAPSFPKGVRPIVQKWDSWQEWLIAHSVCMRHQEHKVFGIFMRNLLPERGEMGAPPHSLGEPVVAFGLVGVLGWVFPDIAVIDTLGLNDHVVARNTDLRAALDPRARQGRQMAHDRKPPPGYVECFRPNVGLHLQYGIYLIPRAHPLTEPDIIACEDQFWQ